MHELVALKFAVLERTWTRNGRRDEKLRLPLVA